MWPKEINDVGTKAARKDLWRAIFAVTHSVIDLEYLFAELGKLSSSDKIAYNDIDIKQ